MLGVSEDSLMADEAYRVYQWVLRSQVKDDLLAPHSINYVTGLTERLYKPRPTIVAGDVVEQIYCDPADQTTPVVKETFAYTDDAMGLPVSRVLTIVWYLADGTEGPHTKVMAKDYPSFHDQMRVINRRRQNRVTAASEAAVQALVGGGMDVASATAAGLSYMNTLRTEIAQYKDGDYAHLIGRITLDTNPSWVPIHKNAMLAELT